MSFTKRVLLHALISITALATSSVAARAQETPTPEPASPASMATPMPAATAMPAAAQALTPIERAYDGNLHVTLAPYIWAPTINGGFQYQAPAIRTCVARLGDPALRKCIGGGTADLNVQVGPNSYLSHLNFAAMGAFDIRKGDVNLFGDYININASTGATFVSSISGPRNARVIPIDLGSTGHVASSLWEIAAGYTLGRDRNADLEIFGGLREAPFNGTLSYSVNIGKNDIISRTGSLTSTTRTTDGIVGIRGKAFFSDEHWFIPYYIDIGGGSNNQTWEGYAGAGYAFNHGQTILATLRSLNYYGFPPGNFVQKLNLGGPLIGYTFGL